MLAIKIKRLEFSSLFNFAVDNREVLLYNIFNN